MYENLKEWLSRVDLTYKKNTLMIGDVSTEDLAKQFKTPLYVINEDLVRKRYLDLKSVLSARYTNIRIHYAVKANTNLALLRIIEQEGGYVDVVSPGEVFLCLKAGFSPDRILYTGTAWSDEELEYALDQKIMINLDAVSHIKRLAKLCEEKKVEKPILSFRINPEFGAGHHDHCITAGKEIKFGIFESQVLEAYQIALDNGFTRFGVHMHIGSGILEVTPFKIALKKYFEIIEKVVKEKKIKFEFIDFGGGIGVPYKTDAKPLDLNEYAEVLISTFQLKCKELGLGNPIFAIEPGRYLCCESTIILTRITTYKDNGFHIFIGVDAGFNTLIRPAFYGSYHEILPCTLREKASEIVADIVGPLCESGDVLGKMRTLPQPKEGDLLAILNGGAYGFTMSSQYNCRMRAAEVLIAQGQKPIIVRERENFEDLLSHQKIPARLEKK